MKVNLLWCSPQALQSSGAMILAILLGIEPCMAEDFKVQQPQLLEVSELFSLKGSEAQLVVLDSDLQNEVSDDPQTGVKSSLQTMAELKPKSVDHPQDWGVIASGDAPLHIADRLESDSAEEEPSAEKDDKSEPAESSDNLWRSGRPDGHAPIGVMGDHTHGAGEVMFSYRFMRMDMAGNRDGTTDLTPAQVLQQFPVTPTEMTTDMHMFGAMYAPTDELTLSVMAPYIFKSMEHVTRMGTRFTTQSDGFGDIQLMGLYKILDQDRQRIHFNAGISFPTGSTNRRDDTPAGPNQVLPYPMQLGSGTFDLHPGITYLGQSDHWSWGGQALGTIRLGTNGNSYRLGNRFNLTGWGARRWNNWFSTSIRLKGATWGNIIGADPRLNPAIIPTANPNLRGGTRLDVGLGLNFLVNQGVLAGHRLAVEFALPVYQSLDGPQLETDWVLTLGWQKAF